MMDDDFIGVMPTLAAWGLENWWVWQSSNLERLLREFAIDRTILRPGRVRVRVHVCP